MREGIPFERGRQRWVPNFKRRYFASSNFLTGVPASICQGFRGSSVKKNNLTCEITSDQATDWSTHRICL